MSAPGSYKWSFLRGEADDENTWQWRKGVIALAVVLVCLSMIFLGWAFARAVSKATPPPQPEGVPTRAAAMPWLQDRVSYTPPPPAEPQVPPVVAALAQNSPEQAVETEQKEAAKKEVNPAILGARGSAFGEYTPKEEERFTAGINGGPCTVTAGSVLQAEIDMAVTTDNPSTVRAIVTNDLLGYGDCRGIPSGTVLVGTPQGAANRNARRMDIAFHTAVIDGVSVDLNDAASADMMGQGGVPAKRNMHLGSRALAVAVATAVDLTRAALAGGGTFYGPVIAQNSGSVIERAANEALDRPTTLTVDPRDSRLPITIVLNQSIEL
jgi:type IV secretory pathway VirB10-like protein